MVEMGNSLGFVHFSELERGMIHIKRFAIGLGVFVAAGLTVHIIVMAIDGNPIPLFVVLGSVISYSIGYSFSEGK